MPHYSPMNPEYKAKWLKALRSCKYTQTKGALNIGNKHMCCLGVLCDIVDPKEWMSDYDCLSFRGREDLPDKSVQKETGLTPAKCDVLVGMNDSGKSFAEIADFIEKRL